MSWLRPLRFLALAGLCLAVSGCGFQPLYGRAQQAVSVADLDTVQLPVIPDREGQILRNYLQESFNPDGRRSETRYHLGVELRRSTQSLGVRRDGTATRFNMTLEATITLIPAGADKAVFTGRAVTTVSYNNLEERFGTVAAEQDALRRGAKTLAANIASRVAVFLKSRKDRA